MSQRRICDEITEETWCQHDYALDKYGNPVSTERANACRWCLMGWLKRFYPNGYMTQREKVYAITQESLVEYNDTHSFEEVKALVCKAGV